MSVRVYRERYTATPPPDAERVTRSGRTVVRWKARGGRPLEGELLPTGKVRVEVRDVWYYGYTLPGGGRVKGLKGYSDKAATDALARQAETAAAREAAGLGPPPGADKPLAAHLSDYVHFLRAKGQGDSHVADVSQRVGYVLDATGARSAADLTEPAVVVAVAARRKPSPGRPGTGRRGIGPATAHGYVSSTKSFLNWMIRARRLVANPLAAVVKEADKSDVRRRRFTEPELLQLLVAAAASRPLNRRRGVMPHGESQVCVYLLAAFTGFRAEEIASLRPGSFLLDGPRPRVVLAAEDAKNGVEAVADVPAIADWLRAFLAGRPPRERVWLGKWFRHGAEMVRADQARCVPPIPYQDARGRFADFHSLRRTFGTKLRDAGVDIKTAQGMMRHSTITLTMDVYADDAGDAEKAAAAARLTPPALPAALPDNPPGRAQTGGGQNAPVSGRPRKRKNP